MIMFVLFLLLLTPAVCLPASCSQDIAPRPSRIPLLQQLCANTIKKTLLYDQSSEITARQFAELKSNINVYTVPIILSALNEALINRIGLQTLKELQKNESVTLVHNYKADNSYDDKGNRIFMIPGYLVDEEAAVLGDMHKNYHTFSDLPRDQRIGGYAYSRDRANIALAMKDCIQIRRTPNGALLKTFDLPGQGYLRHIEFSNDARTLIYSAKGPSIRYLDIATQRCFRILENVDLFRLSPNGKLRACATLAGEVYIYDEETGLCRSRLSLRYSHDVKCTKRTDVKYTKLKWSPDSTYLMWYVFSVDRDPDRYDRMINLWNCYTKQWHTIEVPEQHYCSESRFTHEGEIFIRIVSARGAGPYLSHRFLFQNYLKPLTLLTEQNEVEAKQLILFLLNALNADWSNNKPHPISREDQALFAKLYKLLPFMQHEKLFTPFSLFS